MSFPIREIISFRVYKHLEHQGLVIKSRGLVFSNRAFTSLWVRHSPFPIYEAVSGPKVLQKSHNVRTLFVVVIVVMWLIRVRGFCCFAIGSQGFGLVNSSSRTHFLQSLGNIALWTTNPASGSEPGCEARVPGLPGSPFRGKSGGAKIAGVLWTSCWGPHISAKCIYLPWEWQA